MGWSGTTLCFVLGYPGRSAVIPLSAHGCETVDKTVDSCTPFAHAGIAYRSPQYSLRRSRVHRDRPGQRRLSRASFPIRRATRSPITQEALGAERMTHGATTSSRRPMRAVVGRGVTEPGAGEMV